MSFENDEFDVLLASIDFEKMESSMKKRGAGESGKENCVQGMSSRVDIGELERTSKKRKENYGTDAEGTQADKKPVTVHGYSASQAHWDNVNHTVPEVLNQENSHVDASVDMSLKRALLETFGYNDFRKGQLQVIKSVLKKRDASVYWATGQGKSLCYQIPALHSGKVVIVVSPLISLMQDQCHKLNALSDKQLATFLGSAQNDSTAQTKAFAGHFPLVYMTPEKFVLSVNALVCLHRTKGIALFAIDEAHVLSEWGIDFRPDYRRLSCVRQNQALQDIPILTLTATAIPRVQDDIAKVLRLRDPFISKLSLDRSNLRIQVHLRHQQLESCLKGFLSTWNNPKVRASQEGTIVYVATRKEVDLLANTIRNGLVNPNIRVTTYHAGLSNEHRQAAHLDFLSGQATIIVATVAYAMGIDKPDIRRIIHYGPPKTMEEYFQQIGRAGRDGLPAAADMFCRSTDFDKYQSDFYLGKLSGTALEATKNSMKALKDFSMSRTKCRRQALLQFFGEQVSAGQLCRNCDVCQAKYGNDDPSTRGRDMAPLGAHLVLGVVNRLYEQGTTAILKALAGAKLESTRCRAPEALQKYVTSMLSEMPRKFPQPYFRELLELLTQYGYITTATKSAQIQNQTRGWQIFRVSATGKAALSDPQNAIVLPVPLWLKDVEEKERQQLEKMMVDLTAAGIADRIPKEEVQSGTGETVNAFKKWHSYLDNQKNMGNHARVAQVQELFNSVEDWRTRTAQQLHVAPVIVLPEHVMVMVNYTVATLPNGGSVDVEALKAVGVRTSAIGSFAGLLQRWLDERSLSTANQTNLNDMKMIFGNAPIVSRKWAFAVYKLKKNASIPVWEASYKRYSSGESIQVIAMKQSSGRPVQAQTICSHLLEAVVQGRPVNLQGVARAMPPPNQSEWESLDAAVAQTNLNILGDPATSGPGNNPLSMKDLIRPIVGKIVDQPPAERDEASRSLLSRWYDCMKWYLALKRAAIIPTFG